MGDLNMTNLQKIKHNFQKTVSSLPSYELAELYFLERKEFIKQGLNGQKTKAMAALHRSNKLYKENYYKGPDLFHESHHRYLDWHTDYLYFQMQQDLIANAKREEEHRKKDLDFIKSIKFLLRLSMENKDNETIEWVLESLKKWIKHRDEELSEYPRIIKGIEDTIESNEFFKEHNYFKDVDPLGFRDLSWKRYGDAKFKAWRD